MKDYGNQNQQQYGVNWDYLKTLLALKNALLEMYGNYKRAIYKLDSEKVAKKNLIASLHTFRLSINAQFREYMTSTELETDVKKCKSFEGITYEKYILLDDSVTDEELDRMIALICDWADNRGCFRTLVDKTHAGDSWQYG